VIFKFIIYLFGLELPEDVAPLIELGLNVAMICLVVLLCFINVFGYFIAFYLLEYYNVDKKYPKFKGILNYFKKTSLIFLILELIIGFLGLILLIYLGFSPLFRGF
jgi:hypothetical protein